ncbi:hypothetical protein MTR67_018809, partial [Solanum verrucosum]
IELNIRISEIGGGDFGGGQDAGSEVEKVWGCDEEMYRCHSVRCEKLVMDGFRSLQDIFPDLFALAQHQNKTVVEMWSSQDWKLSVRRLMNDWKIPRLAELYKHLETFQGNRMDKIACGGLDSTSACIRSTQNYRSAMEDFSQSQRHLWDNT